MMDLTLDVEDYKLNIRAAVVIIHNGKLLTHRNIESNHYALLGGRVEIGEDSETTVKREVKEELGKEIEITGYISTVENFFEMKGQKYHEIEFVHKAEFVNEEDKKIEYTLKNIEGEDWIQYEWIEINKIDSYPLMPKVIKKVLKENKFPVHKINKYEVNPKIEAYIEKNIFPLYNRNEEGHGINHIKTVIDRSIELAKKQNVDIDMAYTIAAYHDIGHYIDRKKHEIISAEIFMDDEKMKEFFTEEQRDMMKEAIEDHRASIDHEPRNIYGKIVSTADRTIIDIDNTIMRTYSYGLKHYEGLSRDEQIERVYEHLKEKYGENGYVKSYLEDKKFETALQELRKALSNKNEFIKRIRKITE